MHPLRAHALSVRAAIACDVRELLSLLVDLWW